MSIRIVTAEISIETAGENDMVNITTEVLQQLKKSEMTDGNITIFVVGSTAAITTIEFEPGLCQDFPKMLQRIAPTNIGYSHEEMWHDGNGHSHVKASLIGPSLTVPFSRGKLMLGTWQQIVVIELDTRKRSRKVVVQIIGN